MAELQAVVMAAGYGNRMGPLVNKVSPVQKGTDCDTRVLLWKPVYCEMYGEGSWVCVCRLLAEGMRVGESKGKNGGVHPRIAKFTKY